MLIQCPEVGVTAFHILGVYELSQEWLDHAMPVPAAHDEEESVIGAQDVRLVMAIPMQTRIFHK